MPKASLLLPIDGKLIVIGKLSGERYVFTPQRRVLEIKSRDIQQFEDRTVRKLEGCCLGKRRQNVRINVFEVS